MYNEDAVECINKELKKILDQISILQDMTRNFRQNAKPGSYEKQYFREMSEDLTYGYKILNKALNKNPITDLMF